MSSMHVRSDVINALLPTVACFVDSRFSAVQRTIPHVTIVNNALMTSECMRIDDMLGHIVGPALLSSCARTQRYQGDIFSFERK